jgi:2-hydroxychromene-2-carboxylate isomerase
VTIVAENRPRVFFSFRSPFSWLAITRLRREMPDAHLALEFVPYWEPDAATATALATRGATIHYVPMSKAKHLYILQDTKRLAASLGLPMAWPVDAQPWWEPAHLGWLQARRLGCEQPFYDAVVAARWQRGADISNPGVIREVADAAGLDGETLVRAVENPAIRAEGVDCLARAYDDDIFGVPFFRVGRERYWGVDRLDAFLTTIGRRAPAAAPGPTAAAGAASADPFDDVPEAVRQLVGAYDTDSAGGCG